MLSFIRLSRLNWSGYVKRMDSKGNVSQECSNNPQGSRLRGRPKNRWWICVQADINRCKITICKERSKTEMTGRSPLSRRRSAMDCSAI
jgi:hypothetical protein